MKRNTIKKTLARLLVFAMLLTTAAGFVPAKNVAAAPLSQYLNVEYGIKYTGERAAVRNDAGNAWSIEYFNVADSAFQTGDVFFVSCKISGATSFKQACIQSGANNWDWNTAPKTWVENGIADNTTVCGKIVATKNGDQLSFKIQFDNVVADATVGASQDITLTDLYIMKLGTTEDEATALPANKALNLGTKYTASISAVKNEDVYEAQYFTVNDASYSAGDTYIISYSINGAGDFRQVATQSSLTNYSWADSKKVWAGDGLPNGQDVSGSFTTAAAGNGISFKVRLDSPLETATPGNSVDITLNDLVVVKVANDESTAIPSSMELTKGRKYSGALNAEKDTTTGSWNVQYFNVNTPIDENSQFKISFKISGADSFKQLAVQTNVNGWSWDDAPKMWKSDGIADDTTFSAIIKATQDCEKISFKLWLDSPVDESFDTASVPVTLTNLEVKDIASVANLGEKYQNYFAVGAAVSAAMVSDVEYQNRITGCFKTITAENEMKPDALLNKAASQEAAAANPTAEPVLNLEYSGMTKILDFAEENNLKVRGHALIYAAQTPDWFFHENYTDDGANVSATVMEARMKSYIKQVVEFVDTNYPDVVTSWDVVNEALDDNGNYKDNNWKTIMGNSYIAKAFKYADQFVSNKAKLYYNDFNMDLAAKQTTFLGSVLGNILSIARIDGIGMQEHITLDYPNTANIGTAIDAYFDEDLDVQISELDVQIEADETVEAQATRYADLFTLFKSKSDKISNVTVWGINDGSSWKSAKRPLLFYDDLTPKPAFDSILGLVTPQS